MQIDADIILIDDEEDVLHAGRQAFELAGMSVQTFPGADGVLDELSLGWRGIVITDIKMPGLDGLSLMRDIRKLDADLPVILITGHGDIATAVQSIREGAYDFIEKPFHFDILIDVARRAIEKRRLALENRRLRAILGTLGGLNEFQILGESPAIRRLHDQIGKLARSGADVLIVGETGSGKELVARALHANSSRYDRRFVAINCGAIPEPIIESELFGHEPGAFTGAQGRRIGKFEYADGGTLFLDEIESMPLNMQVKLLRVLQERTIERLGSNKTVPIDVRVISATKTDLLQCSQRGAFREDLYYRLNVANLAIPPLRERRQDIAMLFRHFVGVACERYECPYPPIDEAMLIALRERAWPGNVRELQNEAGRFVLNTDLERDAASLPESGDAEAGAKGLVARVNAFEAAQIRDELKKSGGNITAACKALDMPRKTLYYKLEKYGISRDEFVTPGNR